ncbi:type III pantothenate kinase [Cognatiluteimonas telluris]|jgi:type III pantothenate kinase|uniref:type III pantothenate kinase n=1 Tax=Cognatiluteimonas telluris TaxID=1104775 RepID=UPI00140DE96A|nr:type III pantothenate kinase [Lysobacter telluris]
MSTWLFDLGNTRLKCAPLEGDGIVVERARLDIAHDGARMFPATALDGLPSRFENAFVASVAGDELTTALLDALTQRCTRVTRVRTQRSCAGVRIAYTEPRRLGADRFLALLGAHARGAGASLVVGVGTALTIDLLAGDGRHLGGRIAPSPTLMREGLHGRAAQLPLAGGTYTEFAIDTADALASGCQGAALALIERSRAQATLQLGAPPTVLLHGGGSAALLPHLPGAASAPALVLHGLACWVAAMHAVPGIPGGTGD